MDYRINRSGWINIPRPLNGILFILLALLLILSCLDDDAFAGRSRSSSGWSGGSRSSSSSGGSYRSSSYKSSSSGWSGGSSQRSSSYGSSGGYTEKSPSVPQNRASAAKSQVLSREQASSAMSEYKAQQSRFKYSNSPVKSSTSTRQNVMKNVTINNYHYTPETYAFRQRSFYNSYHWSPPFYAYHFHPSYGIWSAMALWFMLDHIADRQYSMMYYSHRNDDDMRVWRHQAEEAARDNAELKQKLADMDQRVKSMEQEGAKTEEGYVPPDMKDVAISEDVLAKNSQQTNENPWGENPPKENSNRTKPITYVLLGFGGALSVWYLLFRRKY